MKKILIAVLVLISITSYSQLVKKEVIKETRIGIVKRAFTKFAELSYSITAQNDTIYHLYYDDVKYTTLNDWKSIYFNGGYATLHDLYSMLVEAANKEKDKETVFDLGDNSVYIKTSKMMGSKYLAIAFTDKLKIISLFNINKSEINSLFGLKDKDNSDEN